MSNLVDALRYLKLGWSVIPACWPVEGKCGCGKGHTGNSIGKAPLLPTWKDYQSRLPTTEEINRWWSDAPLANLACITGAVSGLVVVDLEYEGIPEAERLGLFSPLTAQTGKGRHLYYKHPGEKVCNAVAMKTIRGFDLRGDGGYVMLPPSRHVTGKSYCWTNGAALSTLLPIFPSDKFSTSKSAGESTLKKSLDVASVLEGLSNGNRNSTFASVVGKLHGSRWTASDIRSLLLPHAMRVQFDTAELDAIIRSITRYPVNIRPGATGNGLAAGGTGIRTVDIPKLTIRTFGTDWADYQRRKNGERTTEFATGYPRFDALLNGGLIKERLLTVAARTGVGKTNWLLGVCRNLCARDKRVLYLSTELSYKKIWDRYISLLGSEEAARSHKLIVSDEFIPNTDAIRQAIEDHKPDVFIFDHIHNVSEENAEVGTYMKSLAMFAKDFAIPGIVAAQLNKDAYWIDRETGRRSDPHMGLIKGASAIIQVSGQVLILDDRDETPEQRDILAVLDKNSDGEKGHVSFVLKKNPYRMEEA